MRARWRPRPAWATALRDRNRAEKKRGEFGNPIGSRSIQSGEQELRRKAARPTPGSNGIPAVDHSLRRNNRVPRLQHEDNRCASDSASRPVESDGLSVRAIRPARKRCPRRNIHRPEIARRPIGRRPSNVVEQDAAARHSCLGLKEQLLADYARSFEAWSLNLRERFIKPRFQPGHDVLHAFHRDLMSHRILVVS